MKNKMSGLLMEVGAPYNKKRLHGKKYFSELLENVYEIPNSVVNLLKLSRTSLEMLKAMQRTLLDTLNTHSEISPRVKLLMTIPGVGEITALTWVLEVGDPYRFDSIKKAVSYCGLCSAQKESAGKNVRESISKKRNKHLQSILIEVAKLAPNWNEQLAEVSKREQQKGNRNRATLVVARKLVAYMLAVDKQQKEYNPIALKEKKQPNEYSCLAKY